MTSAMTTQAQAPSPTGLANADGVAQARERDGSSDGARKAGAHVASQTVSPVLYFVVPAALFIAFLWVGVTAYFAQERTSVLKDRARENTNIARSLQESSVRVLSAVDQATQRLSNAVVTGAFRRERLVQFANETGLTPGILVQLSLVGPDGIFVGSNIDPEGTATGRVDLSQREHVRIHLNEASTSQDAKALLHRGLFIGKPVLGKVSGRWTVQISRKVSGPDGRLLGVIVASLDPAYFESTYRQIDLGAGGSVTLFGADRTIRARVVSGKSVASGAQIGPGSPIATGPLAQVGSYVAVSSLDGVERVVAYVQAGEYPLYVAVATPTALALEDWQSMRNLASLLAALLSVVTVLALAAVARGVRQIERRNQALMASEQRAQAASRAKSDFLAAVSHELRTPLTGIRGFAELMERRLPDDRFREQAGIIRKSAEHLNTLLTDILDFAKIEAGAMSVRLAPVPLRALIAGTAEFFNVSAAQKGLALNVRIDPAAPEQITTDELRLKQILNNLLSNAFKFTEAGSVSIEVEATAGAVKIHVVDTGPGIPAELHDAVFERFRQGSAQVANDHGGTGLGLALARGLAERLGGTLTLESASGQGARFTLTLPRVA